MQITGTTPQNTALTELGRRLARVRKQHGFTQIELARQAGLGVATLRRIEDGQDAQIGSWMKLLSTLGLSQAIEQLLPENISSPMAEVKNKQRRKTAAGKGGWGDGQV
jgi:transcriptional regulator with XRE-family HTH domain